MNSCPPIDCTEQRLKKALEQLVTTLTTWSPDEALRLASVSDDIVGTWLERYSPASLRGYTVDLEAWAAWFIRTDHTESPLAPGRLAAFLIEERKRGNSRSTVVRRATAVRTMLRDAGLWSKDRAEAIRICPSRRPTDATRARKSSCLPTNLLERIVASIDPADPRDLRDAAIAALIIDSLAMPSEFLGVFEAGVWVVPPVNVNDVLACRDGSGRLVLRNLDSGRATVDEPVYLSRRAMACIKAWIDIANLRSGPLFRAFPSNTVVSTLSPPLMPDRMKDIMCRLSRKLGLKKPMTATALREHTTMQMLDQGLHLESVRRAVRAAAIHHLLRQHRGRYVAGSGNDVLRHHEAFRRVRSKQERGGIAKQIELPWGFMGNAHG